MIHVCVVAFTYCSIPFEWIDRKKFCMKVHSTTQSSTSQFRSCLTSGVTPPIHDDDGKALFASVRKALASKTKSRTHITKYHWEVIENASSYRTKKLIRDKCRLLTIPGCQNFRSSFEVNHNPFTNSPWVRPTPLSLPLHETELGWLQQTRVFWVMNHRSGSHSIQQPCFAILAGVSKNPSTVWDYPQKPRSWDKPSISPQFLRLHWLSPITDRHWTQCWMLV